MSAVLDRVHVPSVSEVFARSADGAVMPQQHHQQQHQPSHHTAEQIAQMQLQQRQM